MLSRVYEKTTTIKTPLWRLGGMEFYTVRCGGLEPPLPSNRAPNSTLNGFSALRIVPIWSKPLYDTRTIFISNWRTCIWMKDLNQGFAISITDKLSDDLSTLVDDNVQLSWCDDVDIGGICAQLMKIGDGWRGARPSRPLCWHCTLGGITSGVFEFISAVHMSISESIAFGMIGGIGFSCDLLA